MAIIGHLKAISEDGLSELVGEIRTLDVELNIKLVANDERFGDNSPSYWIFSRGKSGREIRVGSAWKKTIQSGENLGDDFLSLTIDDPGFSHPLNVAAFKSDGQWTWSIVWRRRQDRPNASNSSE